METYYLVQFTGPVYDSWKASLASLGAEIEDYIPDYAFVVSMTPETAQQARLLAHVRWVGLFHPAYRITTELLASNTSKEVVIRVFHGRTKHGVEAEVKNLGGRVDKRASSDNADCLIASLPPKAIRKLLRHPEIAWIEPRLERKLCNTIARNITTVSSAWTGLGLYGAGEIVAVCDTGLDTGDLSTVSADFAGRIFKTYCLGRPDAWSDPDGHGTHVAGSLLGNGVLSGSDPVTHTFTNSYAGLAPEARLLLQSMYTSAGKLGGFPADLKDLFRTPYDDGARVHSNSWDVVYENVYTTDCRNVDQFIWEHRDMNILFAAGNEGKDANANGRVDAGSIMPPATSKNCISVGATESSRMMIGATTYGAYWPTAFPVDPIFSDRVSNNALGMAGFSGRGPCSDGRMKPDICAPGTGIISCRSHLPGAGVLSGAYNADYVFAHGTSMSTPFVAGAATLTRQFYRTVKGITPSAALIKATLINGAKDVTPGQYGTGAYLETPVRPNSVEGWGRIDIGYSIVPTGTRSMWFMDNPTGLSTGGSVTYTYTVTESTDPVRVTLVWSDYPASTAADAALVNDLDLAVTMPSGQVRYGNNGGDHVNNVEGVDIYSPAAGMYTVTVTAPNVPYGPQPYALVVSGDMVVLPPTAALTAPAYNSNVDGYVDIKGTAYGSNFQQYTLAYGVGLSPTSWTPIGSPRTTPVASSLLGTWDTTGLPDGLYSIRLTVTNSAGSSTAYTACNILTTSLAQAKQSLDGQTVLLTGKVVTAGKAEFGTFMYVEEPDRTSGIRINLGSASTDSTIGSMVTVRGTLGLIDGERVLTGPTITTTGRYNGLRPLSLTNRDVGGEALNDNTPGIDSGFGVNNLGLLVSTFGRISDIGPDYFYVDDGSPVNYGEGVPRGVKVYCPGLALPEPTHQYAIVTGISSTDSDGIAVRRLIRARKQTDLVYYP